MRRHIAAIRLVTVLAVVAAISSTRIAAEPIQSSDQAIISGKAKAKDGDSILLGEGKGTVDVRLHAIDAPEWDQDCKDSEGRSQPCGKEAKAQLARLVNGKQLRCEVADVEKGGGRRLIVRCSDGRTNINEAMLANGSAWVFDHYAKNFGDYPALKAIEAEAKAQRRGLWQSEVEPEAPWEFRKRRWERYAARAPNGCPIIAKRTSSLYRTPWTSGA